METKNTAVHLYMPKEKHLQLKSLQVASGKKKEKITTSIFVNMTDPVLFNCNMGSSFFIKSIESSTKEVGN